MMNQGKSQTMKNEFFYRDERLPFFELRATENSVDAFKPHMHHSLSIWAVTSGTVIYHVNGEESKLIPGALALINPETLHSCNPIGESGRSFTMLYLDPDWCLKIQQSLWQVAQFVPLNVIRLDDLDLYERYCTTIEQLQNLELHLQEKELGLVEFLGPVFTLGCKPQKRKIDTRKSIDSLKALLASDLHKDFSLESLAETLNDNPYTLIRSFKAATGLTPHAYRMNCRIERAKTLLKQGRDIGETALECGFFDQSHFHRHFKAMTTITPRAYRVNFVQ